MPTADRRILRSSDRSVRVRRVLSAALRHVLAKRAGILIGNTDSELLARSYTPVTVLDAFAKQREVRRIGLAREESVAVTTWIVASDGIRHRALDLPNEDRAELDRKLAAAFNDIHQKSSELSAAKGYDNSRDRQILELGRSIKAFGPQFRKFIRRADRLWSKQVSTLRIFIDDAEASEMATAKLASVYQKAFDIAIQLGNSDPK